jgi:DNA-binding response OmpR family regulator
MAYLMLVDDDEDFADAAATVLRKAGHEVEIQLEIRAAEESLERKRPDLVILDVMFPEDSLAGFTLARKMRESAGKLKDIPILMLTGVNVKMPLGFSEKDIDESWMPVSDFVEKPVDFDVLRDKVASLLEGAV